jgi:hypothetical protein
VVTEVTSRPAAAGTQAFTDRRKTADLIFRGALLFNGALTIFWLMSAVTGRGSAFFPEYRVTFGSIAQVLSGVLFFYVVWGFIWYGIKTLLLKYFVGFSRDDRRQAFSSRMSGPYEVAELVQRYSERRIRIADMIGRRGRFITLASAALFYLYSTIKTEPTDDFATMFLGQNLFDAVITNWIFLGFFYSNGWLAAAFYGPQSRVMDGVLARANCVLITTLWAGFKFIMLPIGTRLATVYSREEFAVVFALIWGAYVVTDALSEIGGALFGTQRIRVWGIGDVNRKSVGGLVSGLAGALVFCIGMVVSYGLPAPWIGLAVAVAVSSSVFELLSPRGTDDFTMTTSNALICLGFGILVR